jgi:hypothetical protein
MPIKWKAFRKHTPEEKWSSKAAMRFKQEWQEVVFWQGVWKGFVQVSPLTLFSNFRMYFISYFNFHVESPPLLLFLNNWDTWQSRVIWRFKEKNVSKIIWSRCTISQPNTTGFGLQKVSLFIFLFNGKNVNSEHY